jgi:hypothetical protein
MIHTQPPNYLIENLVNRVPRRPAERAFPNNQCPPAFRRKALQNVSVPFAVARDLCRPELRSGGRKFEHRTIVPVPETAVDKHGGPETREHHIRATGKVTTVQAETESTSVQSMAQQQFGFRILAANAAHVQLALRWRQNISHADLRHGIGAEGELRVAGFSSGSYCDESSPY